MTDIVADIDWIERACDLLYIYQLYSLKEPGTPPLMLH